VESSTLAEMKCGLQQTPIPLPLPQLPLTENLLLPDPCRSIRCISFGAIVGNAAAGCRGLGVRRLITLKSMYAGMTALTQFLYNSPWSKFLLLHAMKWKTNACKAPRHAQIHMHTHVHAHTHSDTSTHTYLHTCVQPQAYVQAYTHQHQPTATGMCSALHSCCWAGGVSCGPQSLACAAHQLCRIAQLRCGSISLGLNACGHVSVCVCLALRNAKLLPAE
jgi:hypothetical protein